MNFCGNRNMYDGYYPWNGNGYSYDPYRCCDRNGYYYPDRDRNNCHRHCNDEVVVDVHVEVPEHRNWYY